MAAATTSTRRASRSSCTRLGAETFKAEVEAEYARKPAGLDRSGRARAGAHRRLFRATALREAAALVSRLRGGDGWRNPAFARWAHNNLAAHTVDGYTIVNISLKPEGGIPGDATGDQMRLMADLAERYCS